VLEMEFDGGSGGPPHALDERLRLLEYRADRMRVPLRFAPLLYNLKMHIGLVRERVQADSHFFSAGGAAGSGRSEL
jgi:hypothetical protein